MSEDTKEIKYNVVFQKYLPPHKKGKTIMECDMGKRGAFIFEVPSYLSPNEARIILEKFNIEII